MRANTLPSQGNWSLSLRDMERDIIPMCRAFGMAVGESVYFVTLHSSFPRIFPLRKKSGDSSWKGIDMIAAPWGALGGGKYKTPEELKEREKENTLRGGMAASERDIQVSAVLAEVAKELGGEPALASGTLISFLYVPRNDALHPFLSYIFT